MPMGGPCGPGGGPRGPSGHGGFGGPVGGPRGPGGFGGRPMPRGGHGHYHRPPSPTYPDFWFHRHRRGCLFPLITMILFVVGIIVSLVLLIF